MFAEQSKGLIWDLRAIICLDFLDGILAAVPVLGRLEGKQDAVPASMAVSERGFNQQIAVHCLG